MFTLKSKFKFELQTRAYICYVSFNSLCCKQV